NIRMIRMLLGQGRDQIASAGMSMEVAADLALAAMQLPREGDDENGYVVRMIVPGGTGSVTFFVIREDGTYRILASSTGFEAVGPYALQLLEQGKVEQAALWMDRVRRELSAGGADDPLSGSRFARVWQQNQTNRSADAIRRAAAVL